MLINFVDAFLGMAMGCARHYYSRLKLFCELTLHYLLNRYRLYMNRVNKYQDLLRCGSWGKVWD